MIADKIHRYSWGLLDSLILLSLVAAWISPLVSLKIQKLSVRENLFGLVVLFLLGSGISISNTVEAIKALLTRRDWEFKRTPKYANLHGKSGWKSRRYQVPLDFVFFLELGSVFLGLVAITFAVERSHYAVLVILVPYTASYIFISLLTYLQSRPQVAV
jgi:hypothetical protein